MRRSLAIGGTLTRGDIEQLLDTCDRLLAERDEIVRILGDLGPAWTDIRAALNEQHAMLRAPGFAAFAQIISFSSLTGVIHPRRERCREPLSARWRIAGAVVLDVHHPCGGSAC